MSKHIFFLGPGLQQMVGRFTPPSQDRDRRQPRAELRPVLPLRRPRRQLPPQPQELARRRKRLLRGRRQVRTIYIFLNSLRVLINCTFVLTQVFRMVLCPINIAAYSIRGILYGHKKNLL